MKASNSVMFRWNLTRMAVVGFAILATIASMCLTSAPAFAQQASGIWNEADAAMAKRQGKLILGDLRKLGNKVLRAIPELQGLEISSPEPLANDQGLMGRINFLGRGWDIIIHTPVVKSNGAFIALKPDTAFGFKDLIKGNLKAAGEVVDKMFLMDQAMLVVSAKNGTFAHTALPPEVAEVFQPIYAAPQYTVNVPQGIALIGSSDLAKTEDMRKAIQFLGGQSSRVVITGAVGKGGVAGGAAEVYVTAQLPKWQAPKIGGILTLPSVQFELSAGVSPTSAGVFFSGKTDNLPILAGVNGKTGMPKTIQVPARLVGSVKADAGALPTVSFDAYVHDGKPWKNAYDLPWLTIENQHFGITAKPSGALEIRSSGSTVFGEKRVQTVAGFQTQATTLGIPLPSEIGLKIDDGPTKVGSIALKDFVLVLRDIAKAARAPWKLDVNQIPHVAIVGAGPGKGPSINLQLDLSGSSIGLGSIDVSGGLRLLNADLGTLERGMLDPQKGIILKTHGKTLPLGPITLPEITTDIHLTTTSTDPRILIKSEGLSLLGSNSDMELEVRVGMAELKAANDFGSLFKTKFHAFAGLGKGGNIDLSQADLFLNAALSSDPGKWLASEARDGVINEMSKIKGHAAKARADLEQATADVTRINNDIERMRNQVRKERNNRDQAITSARNELNKLNAEVSKIESQLRTFESRIKACTQTVSVCVRAEWFECKQWRNDPDLPARAICELGNAPRRTEAEWAKVRRDAVIVARDVAKGVLDALMNGLNEIPVDADPRVAALFAARDSALVSIDAAKLAIQAVAEIDRAMQTVVNAAFAAIGNEVNKGFAIRESLIQGNVRKLLEGHPVILALDFTSFNNPYSQKFAFKIATKPSEEAEVARYNLAQLEVLALGTVVDAFNKFLSDNKLMSPEVYQGLANIYANKKAAVDAEVARVMALHGGAKVFTARLNSPDPLNTFQNNASAVREGLFRRVATRQPAVSFVGAPVTRHGRGTGILKTDCPKGQFAHLLAKPIMCYSCPPGTIRSTEQINSPRACFGVQLREVAGNR